LPTIGQHAISTVTWDFTTFPCSRDPSEFPSFEQLKVITGLHLSQARGVAFRQTVTTQGWATEDHLDDICAEIEDWCEHPDAFRVELWCAALGRVPASHSARD